MLRRLVAATLSRLEFSQTPRAIRSLRSESGIVRHRHGLDHRDGQAVISDNETLSSSNSAQDPGAVIAQFTMTDGLDVAHLQPSVAHRSTHGQRLLSCEHNLPVDIACGHSLKGLGSPLHRQLAINDRPNPRANEEVHELAQLVSRAHR